MKTKVKVPLYKRWWFYLILTLITIGGVKELKNIEDEKKELTISSTTTHKNAITPEASSDTSEDSEVPREYRSALKKAQMYAQVMSMSKGSIYQQLTSEYGEKFSEEAAKYAIDHVQADWNANALKKAKTYQDSMAMSPQAIRDQLTSEHGEKFTLAEADYAILHLND